MVLLEKELFKFLAPQSTKNLAISFVFSLIAMPRGHSKISREFHKIMMNMKIKRMLLNNDKYEEKENFIKQ